MQKHSKENVLQLLKRLQHLRKQIHMYLLDDI